MEYELDHLQLDAEPENETGFGKCALYYLCSSMKRIWEGKEEFPALIGWDGPPMLDYTCGPDHKGRLIVRTDQNTLICEKHSCFGKYLQHNPYIILKLVQRNFKDKSVGCRCIQTPSILL